MSEWRRCNWVDFQSRYSWFTSVQIRAPALFPLFCFSQSSLWRIIKRILLRAHFLYVGCAVQKGEIRNRVAWSYRVQCSLIPSEVRRHWWSSAPGRIGPHALLYFGDLILLWRELVPMNWEENISSSIHIKVWAYTASSFNLLVVQRYIINLRQ